MLKCLHCNGTLAPGKLIEGFKTRFQPNNASMPFFSFQNANVEVTALMCESCGRIELRGDTEKLREVLQR
ncbi:hypothetical protein B1R32_105117 [Abditibacterium utsteinense]|uniref:Uncharacterized protein n=1 Tax=Abditibacterium utsteinense TaxID=1960156 RepID=A0A2S8SUH2_9BACT|nr:hypothetical protein B1R32_105117 [Abditibacterium utsteinense]